MEETKAQGQTEADKVQGMRPVAGPEGVRPEGAVSGVCEGAVTGSQAEGAAWRLRGYAPMPACIQAQHAHLYEENCRLWKMAKEVRHLLSLPNWENRCGPWKDINDAMRRLHEAVKEQP